MNHTRKQVVHDILVSKPFTSLKELEERFPNISSMTLRRDIEFFERQGDVIKVRGGARSMKYILSSEEESFQRRLSENKHIKQKLAKTASSLFESGRSIYIDSGTTCIELCSYIPEVRLNLTTSGPNIALALLKHQKVMVNLVGGFVNRDNLSVSGDIALQYINSINIDIAIISPSGFSLEEGFSSGNFNESKLKHAVTEKARKVVILLLSDKIGKTLPFTFCDLTSVSTIITDKPLPAEFTVKTEKLGIQVLVTE